MCLAGLKRPLFLLCSNLNEEMVPYRLNSAPISICVNAILLSYINEPSTDGIWSDFGYIREHSSRIYHVKARVRREIAYTISDQEL